MTIFTRFQQSSRLTEAINLSLALQGFAAEKLMVKPLSLKAEYLTHGVIFGVISDVDK